MHNLSEVLKLEFTPKNQLLVTTLLGNFAFTLNADDRLWNVINSTMLDIDTHGINNYHYRVIEMCEELVLLQVL